MIRNFIFDLGGVLIDFDPDKTLKALYAPEDAAFIKKNVFQTREWSEIDRGVLTPDEAFSHLSSQMEPAVFHKMMDMVNNWGNYMPPFEDTFDFVKKVKAAGYKIYLLSNIPLYFYSIKDSIPALSLFDGFVISAEEKVIKPDPAIFRVLLERFGLKAEECVFIDDMPRNTRGAEACGLHGCCFSNHDFNALYADLKALGVNL